MNNKSLILRTLAGSGDEYISGTRLAKAAGVSRNAVWKTVQALSAEGFLIDAVRNKGYRLSPENNHFSGEIITAGLDTSVYGRSLHIHDCVSSTNELAKKLAGEGAADGTAIIADSQSSGKGRLGRSFVSPSGTGIYLSLIIRPRFGIDAAQLITSCAACAAAEAVEELCGKPAAIKWVNDLWMNGKKICGILTEASLSLETRSLDYAVIGIGINVLSVKDIFSGELGDIASSIEDEAGIKISRNRLCSVLLNRLEKRISQLPDRDFLDEYRRRELLTGNIITAGTGIRQLNGKAIGIDDNAGLVIRLEDGSLTTISSGEANLCRIKSV